VLVGTEETENELALEDEGSYRHVTVLHSLAKPDLKMLETIKSAQTHLPQLHLLR